MANEDRRISGVVKTRTEASVASVAYEMARDLWIKATKNGPSIHDGEFFVLVRMCVMVLEGRGTLDDIRKHVAEMSEKVK